MSDQPFLPGFDAPAGRSPTPATDRSAFATQRRAAPGPARGHQRATSGLYDARASVTMRSTFANYPTSKQVAFAERIARIKRREIPQACFRDKLLMSRWIDGNKPR